MIARLTGTLSALGTDSLIVDVHGVGYRIYTSTETISGLPSAGETVSFWTYLAVRETALDLYGFHTQEELQLFELLISVSGIGPRSGLAILSLASPALLQKAISAGETSYLTKVSGIGRKTAEKIVLELRDKIGTVSETTEELKGDTDVIEVLKSLGYSHIEARDAIKQLSPETTGTNDRIKEALKKLGQQ